MAAYVISFVLRQAYYWVAKLQNVCKTTEGIYFRE